MALVCLGYLAVCFLVRYFSSLSEGRNVQKKEEVQPNRQNPPDIKQAEIPNEKIIDHDNQVAKNQFPLNVDHVADKQTPPINQVINEPEFISPLQQIVRESIERLIPSLTFCCQCAEGRNGGYWVGIWIDEEGSAQAS